MATNRSRSRSPFQFTALTLVLASVFGCDGETEPATAIATEESSLAPLTIVAGSDEVGATELDAANEMAVRAEAVFIGEVVAIEHRVSEPDAQGTPWPFTLVTWQVADGIKGVETDTRYSARFIGGPIGELELEVSDVPEFELGDRDLLFVERNGEVGCPLVGGAQGRVQLEFGGEADGVSRVAPGPGWANEIAAGIRAAGLGGGAPARVLDVAAPFGFAMPRVATRAELERVQARHLERLAELDELGHLDEPSALDDEQLALEANDFNPVMSR